MAIGDPTTSAYTFALPIEKSGLSVTTTEVRSADGYPWTGLTRLTGTSILASSQQFDIDTTANLDIFSFTIKSTFSNSAYQLSNIIVIETGTWNWKSSLSTLTSLNILEFFCYAPSSSSSFVYRNYEWWSDSSNSCNVQIDAFTD